MPGYASAKEFIEQSPVYKNIDGAIAFLPALEYCAAKYGLAKVRSCISTSNGDFLRRAIEQGECPTRFKYRLAYACRASAGAKRNKTNVRYVIFTHGKVGALIELERRRQQNSAASKKAWAGRVDEEGNRIGSRDVRHFLRKGYTEEEAKAAIHASSVSGGRKAYDTAVARGTFITNTSIQFYLNRGMDEVEAREALAERQKTCSLESYIKRHGKEEGTRLHAEKTQRWLDAFYDRTPEEMADIVRRRTGGSSGFSSVSFERMCPLIEAANSLGLEVLSGEKELMLRVDADVTSRGGNKFYYKYDFAIPELKLIVEYQGWLYHAPVWANEEEKRLWEEKSGCVYEVELARDELKREVANRAGWRVEYVWSEHTGVSEFRQVAQLIELMRHLYEENQSTG